MTSIRTPRSNKRDGGKRFAVPLFVWAISWFLLLIAPLIIFSLYAFVTGTMTVAWINRDGELVNSSTFPMMVFELMWVFMITMLMFEDEGKDIVFIRGFRWVKRKLVGFKKYWGNK